jgi:hypothetical protein
VRVPPPLVGVGAAGLDGGGQLWEDGGEAWARRWEQRQHLPLG